MRPLLLLSLSLLILVACDSSVGPSNQSPTPIPLSFPETYTPTASTPTEKPTFTFPFLGFRTAIPTSTLSPEQIALQQTNEARPTITRTPTPIPPATPTSPPIPPLRAHEWVPEDVLVDISFWCGDGGYCPSGKGPQLTLYGNGLLLKLEQGGFGQFTRLDRREICKVLNTIEQTGFAQYDQSTYFSTAMGGGAVEIAVNSWFQKAVDLLNLGLHMTPRQDPSFHPIPQPVILSSLKETFYFLRYHEFDNWRPYIPDRIAIRLYELSPDAAVVEWPFDSIRLAEMLDYDSRSWQAVILQGDLALEWYETMTEEYYYTQDGLVVGVSHAAVPPHEDISEYVVLGDLIEPTDISANEPLSCKVTDGVYPIPTPETP